MLSVRIFNNHIPQQGDKYLVELEKDIVEFENRPVLFDEVDTTITSFLKAYGQPPHIELEDGEFPDVEDDDDVDDIVAPVESVDTVVDKPINTVVDKPIEPVVKEDE